MVAAALRYVPHILLLYLAIGAQRGLDAALRYGETRVDFPLIVALFVAACLPRTTGPIAAALAGLAYDFSGNAPIGLHALCYGLAGLLAARLPANRPVSLAFALLAGVVVACTLRAILFLIRGTFYGDVSPYFWGWPGTILLTGGVAVLLTPLLFKYRKPFVIQDRRYY